MHGGPEAIAEQYAQVLQLGHRVDAVVAHPIPTPSLKGPLPRRGDYLERFATEVLPRIEALMA